MPFPKPCPAGQPPPLVVFAEPTDPIIQLLSLATSITPELIMGLCVIGILCVLVLCLLCVCMCVRCVRRGTCWPCPHQGDPQHVPHGQLSDMALHYYALVQEQNPGLLNVVPMGANREQQRNMRRR